MNKFKFMSGSLVLLLMSVFVWSCKDDFTDEDLLTLQNDLQKDSIALTIQVFNGTISARSANGRSEGTEGLANIAISLTAQGRKLTGTTDADGQASFWVQPGSVTGTLKATGFTTINFQLSVNESENGSQNNASVQLPVFETTGARVARVTGIVQAETNLLNSTRENAPDGVTIAFSPNFNNATLLDGNASGADVDKFIVEGTWIASVTNGSFTIDLPTALDGVSYTYTIADFIADQTLAINNYTGEVAGSIRGSVTIPSVFSNSITAATVPTISALQLDIEAPPASFTTAATATAPVLAASDVNGNATNSFADFLNTTGFTVVSGGSGYPASSNSIAVTVTPVGGAPTTNAILYAQSNANGQITGIMGAGTDPDGAGPLAASVYGAGYRGRATLTIGGGTGAIVVPNYSSSLESLTLTAGAGYVLAPTLSVRGLDVNGNSIEATGSTTISGGSIVSFTAPGQAFSSITSMTFIPVVRNTATFNSGLWTVNAQGEISVAGNGLTTGGSGYNPAVAPAVTVRNLRTGGIGAAVIAEMSGGSVNTLTVTNPGSGYFTGNANFPTATGFTLPATNNLIPGVARVINIYCGTGAPVRPVQ